MELRGQRGELRVGYVLAARLGPWLAQLEAGSGEVTASVSTVDTYWITQTPMTLILWLGHARWEWSAVAVTIEGRSVRVATTGRPAITKEAVI